MSKRELLTTKPSLAERVCASQPIHWSRSFRCKALAAHIFVWTPYSEAFYRPALFGAKISKKAGFAPSIHTEPPINGTVKTSCKIFLATPIFLFAAALTSRGMTIDTGSGSVVFQRRIIWGDLTKLGSGLLTLTGSNSYTGATEIEEGTLKLSGVGTLGDHSVVTILNGATLDLNGTRQTIGGLNDNLTSGSKILLGKGKLIVSSTSSRGNVFHGMISGSGGLTVLGYGGGLELDGNNIYTGPTNIGVRSLNAPRFPPHFHIAAYLQGAGLLTINGSVAGNVFVNSGILTGSGIIHGNLTNFDAVFPGKFDSVASSALAVGKDFFQDPRGSLFTHYTLSGCNRLVIHGMAVLNGDLWADGAIMPSHTYVILTAAKGVTGRFQPVDPFFSRVKEVIGYDPNDVTVTFEYQTIEQALSANPILPRLTPNEKAISSAMDQISNKSSILEGVPLTEMPAALDLISPEDLAVIFESAYATDRVQGSNLEQRMEDIRQGSTGFSANGLNISDADGRWSDGNSFTVNSADNSLPLVGEKQTATSRQIFGQRPQTNERLGFFAMGSGEFGDVENEFSVRGSDFSTGGLTVGADYRFSDSFAAGIAGGYANTWADLNEAGRVGVNSGQAHAYATWFESGFYINGLAGAGWSSYDAKRQGLDGLAVSAPNGNDYDALLGAGYDYQAGAFTVGPIASLQYINVELNGFNESGSLAPLQFNSQTQESLMSYLGAKASYQMNLRHVIIRPELQAQWEHEYMDSTAAVVSRFAAGSPFTVYGPAIGRDGLLLNAGVSVQIGPRLTVGAYYAGELARANYSVNTISGACRLEF